MLISVMAMGLFGIVLERFVFRPFLGDINLIIVVCIGIITVLKKCRLCISDVYCSDDTSLCARHLQGGNCFAELGTIANLFHWGWSVNLVLLFINKTKQGLQMRAVAQDKEGAILQGINVNFISALACVIACALAAVCGFPDGFLFNREPVYGG